jgi:hypothetical protein
MPISDRLLGIIIRVWCGELHQRHRQRLVIPGDFDKRPVVN